jgi:competence protein ComGC
MREDRSVLQILWRCGGGGSVFLSSLWERHQRDATCLATNDGDCSDAHQRHGDWKLRLRTVLVFFPLSLVAVVLGHLSLSEIRQSAGRIGGHGMAVAGLVLGYLGLCAVPILIIAAIAIPNLLRARTAANEASAASAVRNLNTAEVRYANDHIDSGYTCSLQDLQNAGLIDESLASGTRYGYRFRVEGCGGRTGGPMTQYQISAFPVRFNQSGIRQFCSDESGVIKSSSSSRQSCMESEASQ